MLFEIFLKYTKEWRQKVNSNSLSELGKNINYKPHLLKTIKFEFQRNFIISKLAFE